MTQRACIRLPCNIATKISFSGGDSEIVKKAIISNISTTGIQILSPSFVATGQTLTASFKVPGKRKGIYKAEIMRIESLQGRMPGHFPYALGAKFKDFSKKQEKQIAHFIEGKVSCRSWRLMIAAILAFLASIEIRRIMPSSYLNPSLANFDFGSLATWISVFLSMGYITCAFTVALNSKIFPTLSKIFIGISASLSAGRMAFQTNLLSDGSHQAWMWGHELILFIIQIALIISIGKVVTFLRSMKKVLSEEKIYSAEKKPTFTIL